MIFDRGTAGYLTDRRAENPACASGRAQMSAKGLSGRPERANIGRI
jgi:hypothetical protein